MSFETHHGRHGEGAAAAAVLFDLDGTLTRPLLDFDLIREEIGLPTSPRAPILEALEQMDAVSRARAEAILDRHEESAARSSQLQDGAIAMLEALRGMGIPTGLITRNNRRCVELTLARHGLAFEHIHTREDGPVKPSPEPLF